MKLPSFLTDNKFFQLFFLLNLLSKVALSTSFVDFRFFDFII